jgi:hypothetical protein
MRGRRESAHLTQVNESSPSAGVTPRMPADELTQIATYLQRCHTLLRTVNDETGRDTLMTMIGFFETRRLEIEAEKHNSPEPKRA